MSARPIVLAAAMAVVALGTTSRTAWAIDPPHDVYGCESCHLSHNASYPAQLGSLCESCHVEGGPAPAVATHSSRTTDAGYGNWEVDCWGCHDPHQQRQDRAWGTAYGKLLRVSLRAQIKEIDPGAPGPYWPAISTLRTVSGTTLRYTAPTEAVDGDAEATDDVCQVCHEQTTNYGAGAFNSHSDYGADSQPGGNCTACHQHTGGFGAGGGGGCTSCHANPQGAGQIRREVVGAAGDFVRTSHHVTDGTATEIVVPADCEVCHDQVTHQELGEPTVLLRNADAPAVTYTYDGTGASISPFCLSCHDADSSLAFDADGNAGNGQQPFTDGRTPPDISTSWAGSSHATGLATEACLSCHGGVDSSRPGIGYEQNAHGAAAAYLLSGTAAGETATNAQEGLCFTCHDPDGPAADDIESSFAGTETWTSGRSGASLDTHHDVSDASQAYSGAVIECRNCHAVHAARAGSLVLADPDPNDGRVPAAGNSWAGSTLMSEWCVECHDGSYPPGVTPPTVPLANVLAEHTGGDQHGTGLASRNVALRPGSGWSRGDILTCETCHVSNHDAGYNGATYPNLAQLRPVIYSKDGLTELTPDWTIAGQGNLVRFTDGSAGNADPLTNGRAWCSTCHPDPMGGQKSTGCMNGSCHNHGASSF